MSKHLPGRRMLAAALATAGLATCWAGAAQASTTRIAGTEELTITAKNVDFGGTGFDHNKPTGPATLRWLQRDGLPQPEIIGTIHIDKAQDDCAYIELLSVNAIGEAINRLTSPTLCADSQDHDSLDVDITGPAQIDVNAATVILHFVTGQGDAEAGSAGHDFGPFPHDVQIDEDGVDFGTAFSDDHPTSPGSLAFSYAGFGPRTTLTGLMHLKGVSGLCARMQIEYLDVLGTVLDTRDGRRTCAKDDGIKKTKVNLDEDVGFTAVTARVELQTLGNDQKWRTAGSQDVGLSTPYVPFEYTP